MQKSFAGHLKHQLARDFESDDVLESIRVYFDKTHVEALQESQFEKARRYGLLVQRDIAKFSEARRALGFSVEPGDEVYASERKLAQEMSRTEAAA